MTDAFWPQLDWSGRWCWLDSTFCMSLSIAPLSQCPLYWAEQTSSHWCAAHAVARKANATVDEMQAAVSMQLLDVLLILTHSQANRQRLLSLGLLTALAHSMKVSPLSLHNLTSIKYCCSITRAQFSSPGLTWPHFECSQ